MKQLIAPTTLPGFMELSPNEQIIFDKIKATLEDTYKLFGFFPIDTPILEKSEVLLAKAGGETEKQIYRFNKGDTDISMRFDLTVPLAKYVAKNCNELVFPFKRYQIGKVYRGERAQRGRFREFYQADIDIVGNSELNLINDAEIPSVIYKAFTSLGLTDFTIRINNRKILNGLLEIFSIFDKSTNVLQTIDKIEKIGLENVLTELKKFDIQEQTAKEFLDVIFNKDCENVIIDKLKNYLGRNETFDLGYYELNNVVYYMEKFGVPRKNYRIDLTIARGLDYYTGTVYETTLDKHPEIGSVCSGGRYDNLAEYYTDNKFPGVGMSIGLSRLFYILKEIGYYNENMSNPADVLIIPMIDDLTKCVETAAALRENNIGVQVFTEQKKIKYMLSYADKLSIPYVIFIGENEINSNTLSVKKMTSGVQESLSLDKTISMIKSEKIF